MAYERVDGLHAYKHRHVHPDEVSPHCPIVFAHWSLRRVPLARELRRRFIAASASAERTSTLEFFVLAVVGFFPLRPFQRVPDVGGRWCITRGPAKRMRKFWNTVEVNIMRIGSRIFCRITHSLLGVMSKDLDLVDRFRTWRERTHIIVKAQRWSNTAHLGCSGGNEAVHSGRVWVRPLLELVAVKEDIWLEIEERNHSPLDCNPNYFSQCRHATEHLSPRVNSLFTSDAASCEPSFFSHPYSSTWR